LLATCSEVKSRSGRFSIVTGLVVSPRRDSDRAGRVDDNPAFDVATIGIIGGGEGEGEGGRR
jgi:hypothetical protein